MLLLGQRRGFQLWASVMRLPVWELPPAFDESTFARSVVINIFTDAYDAVARTCQLGLGSIYAKTKARNRVTTHTQVQ